MPEVRVYSKKQKIPNDICVVNLDDDFLELNPINIPCSTYKGRKAKNLFNAWECSKVYKDHSENGLPSQKYWDWAFAGWDSDKPVKVTKKKYLYHMWDGAKYGIIEARKHIFASKYIRAISNNEKFYELKNIVKQNEIVGLVSKNGLDHKKISYVEALFNPDKEFDYAFLLAMMLSRDVSLTDIP